jgi:hypothetical protein
MYQYCSSRLYGLVDELAGCGQVYEKISRVLILDRNPEKGDPAFGQFSGDGVVANGDNVGDVAFR